MKSVLVLSDIHVGGTTAVCSPKPYISDTDSVHTPNQLQRQLYQGWRSVIRGLSREPDLLVVNGEPIDGANPRQLGNESWSTNLADQIADAEKLISMVPHKKLAFVRGSGYHVSQQGTNFEEILASKMGAVKTRSGCGRTHYFAEFNIDGVKLNFTHHVGFSRAEGSRPGALSREMAMVDADVIVRSHVHYYTQVHNGGKVGVTTPAWKYPDGHLYRSGMATVPDIGAVEITVHRGDVRIEPHIVQMPRFTHMVKV